MTPAIRACENCKHYIPTRRTFGRCTKKDIHTQRTKVCKTYYEPKEERGDKQC